MSDELHFASADVAAELRRWLSHLGAERRMSGKTVYVESLSQDLYAAIDTLIDKLDRQVGKHKTRLQDHHHEAPKRVM